MSSTSRPDETSAPRNRLPATLEDSIGPYFPPSFALPFRHDLSRHEGMVVQPRGEIITLQGTVRDLNGDPVAPALLEFWQANAEGRFRTPLNGADPTLDPWFDGYARLYAADGQFHLHTVKPGPVAAEDGPPRAPHVTLTIFCDGISKLTTQIFFDDEPANEADPLLASLPSALRPRLIARRVQAEIGAAVYALDIVLRGEGETPFFDDIES